MYTWQFEGWRELKKRPKILYTIYIRASARACTIYMCIYTLDESVAAAAGRWWRLWWWGWGDGLETRKGLRFCAGIPAGHLCAPGVIFLLPTARCHKRKLLVNLPFMSRKMQFGSSPRIYPSLSVLDVYPTSSVKLLLPRTPHFQPHPRWYDVTAPFTSLTSV